MGLKLIFLIVTRAVSLLGLSRREWWWKDAEILMLRHQLAVAERERPRAHSRLTWPDRAWLGLLAGTDVQWVESFVTGDKIYCIYIAPDEAAVREHATRGGFPANRISEVTHVIDPTTAEASLAAQG